jgi:excisionase family DNA binding protein
MEHRKLNIAAKAGGPSPTAEAAERLLTTEDVAVALKVSVRTVERMVHDGEIKPLRLRGLVRFRLEDVVEALRNGGRKWGRKAALTGNPNSETRNPKGAL